MIDCYILIAMLVNHYYFLAVVENISLKVRGLDFLYVAFGMVYDNFWCERKGTQLGLGGSLLYNTSHQI